MPTPKTTAFFIQDYHVKLPFVKNSPPENVPPLIKKAPPPMRKYEGIVKFIQAHLFGGGCATVTAVSSTIEKVSSCRGQYGSRRYRMFPQDTKKSG